VSFESNKRPPQHKIFMILRFSAVPSIFRRLVKGSGFKPTKHQKRNYLANCCEFFCFWLTAATNAVKHNVNVCRCHSKKHQLGEIPIPRRSTFYHLRLTDKSFLVSVHSHPLDSQNLGEWPSCLCLLFGLGIFGAPDIWMIGYIDQEGNIPI